MSGAASSGSIAAHTPRAPPRSQARDARNLETHVQTSERLNGRWPMMSPEAVSGRYARPEFIEGTHFNLPA
eukprot:6137090-Prymnesium_polylepis.1